MEKADMKFPVIMEEPKKSGVAGRYIAILAGAVVFLAIAFIIFISVGAYALNNQECETTTAIAPHPHSTVQNENKVTSHNQTIMSEHTTMYVEDQMEFIVSRHPDSGLVSNVITIDYNKGVTTMYLAEWHMCFLVQDAQNSFDEDLSYLRNHENGGPVELSEKRRYFQMNNKVDDPDDIPTQMAPFCTTHNSLWLADEDDEQRSKRDVSCQHLVYISGGGYDGYYVISWTQTGNGPCVFPCCYLLYYYSLCFNICHSGSNSYASACPSLAQYC